MYEDGPYYEPQEHTKEVPVTIDIGWSNSNIEAQVVSAISKQILDDISGRVQAAVFDKLDDVVNGVILAAMDKEVQHTDSWGKPVGNVSSVRELLMRDAEAWLNDRVDEYGNSGRDGYSKKQTRAQYLFKAATKEDLAPRVKKIVAANIADIDALIEQSVKQQLRAKLK